MECGGKGVACDTVFNSATTGRAARLSSGCLLQLTSLVIQNEIVNGFAVIRPPGHHAEANEAMGFSFFNNVSIAAAAAKAHGMKRILIVDWDIHHGNGTQNIFYNDPSVLYLSLHRHDDGNFYPYTGDADECGAGEGVGKNVNIPWRGNGAMGNNEYLAAFYYVVMPIARQFNPELVFISAGFDAAEGDLIGNYKVTPAGFARMTAWLKELAGGKVILALEGGYDLNSLSTCATACIRVLLGEQPPPIPPSSNQYDTRNSNQPSSAAITLLKRVINIQREHWSELRMPSSFDLPYELYENTSSAMPKSPRGSLGPRTRRGVHPRDLD
ncbi:hypothetical protein, variant [Capsaspora owczarzaki ATCC 30864]|uniref:histone deacetylase n=2 Tax=Capsaspora owczarzaki (strain ATCC 30864) TaxID=595528 RepID=A0A0D2WT57_CAPO3|nr:hypothetical protein, variant [Capsaspora owczarzaki ATCC 30864]